MRRFCLLLLLCFPVVLYSQQIQYDFSAPNAAHHEAHITVTVTDLMPGPVEFRMSRSSPGRYARHEFGKNVYDVLAADGGGKPLPLEKTDADVYTVTQHRGTVVLSYTLFGNYADGTYASIDPSGYHLNMPASFLWIKGLENLPVNLTFSNLPKDWTIATQLKPGRDVHSFTAPNLQYFMDSPVKLGELHVRDWNILNPGNKSILIRLALDAGATENSVSLFAEKLQGIVKEAQAVFGELPAYDFGSYTFIAGINPYVHTDGMEHRNSTVVTNKQPFSDNNNLLSTFAHEFFHCWNVERIRPKNLEPFNFEKSNMSESLWIAEGFTEYYQYVLMKRAGLISEAEFMQKMGWFINTMIHSPGCVYYTPVENSTRAVFVDAGVSVDQVNFHNMYTSYYTHGAALALALDLQLRKQYNKTLDGFMKLLWNIYGKPENPYMLAGIQEALANFTSPAFASEFFNKHIYSTGAINYNDLLQAAGYNLEKINPGESWIGDIQFTNNAGQLVVAGATLRNTPLYNAGVDAGDILIQLDDVNVHYPKDILSVLAKHLPGDVVKLIYLHRGEPVEITIKLEENPSLIIMGTEPTTAQKQFRNNWLESKAALQN